jgi:hypothetical protein
VLTDRRKARRRNLPFLRSAVLEAGGRKHIVSLTDLSPEGAFLSTRVPVAAEEELRLHVVLPRDGREVVLPCHAVRATGRFDPGSGRPAGLAVRFRELEEGVARRVEEFAMEGFRPATEPIPLEHVEYRILERPGLDAAELNRLGLDGWRLTVALPIPQGLRLVLVRSL